MSRAINCAIPRKELAEHPAVQAWRKVASEQAEPVGIDILELRRKSAVYRLAGVGPDGAAVIAKRSLAATARVERVIHRECLPRVPVPAPRCYGFITDQDNTDFCWLFLEDAAGQEYSNADASHRALAGHWLGAVHATLADGDAPGLLPRRDVDHYFRVLHQVHTSVLENGSRLILTSEEEAVFRVIAAQCEVIEAHWGEIEHLCEVVPATLVHGDLVVKNVQIRGTPDPLSLMIFDWETAGWGTPATDLCQGPTTLSPDLAIYCERLKQGGRRLELSRARRLAEYGSVLRLLDAIKWETAALSPDSYEDLTHRMSRMRAHERDLDNALQIVNWARGSRP